MMKNEGSILANELDEIRIQKLKYNIEQQGAKIVTVNNDYGEKIGVKYTKRFDKILLDTPCSGEGRFIAKDAKSYRNWSPKKVLELVKIQKKLLRSAYEALKPNGIMVYSTCTLNVKENDEIIKWALDEFDLELLPIQLELKASELAILDSNIRQAIKILPSKNMEGFFVAKMMKK